MTKCEENLLWYQQEELRWNPWNRAWIPYVATYSRCIASDDLRLKEELRATALLRPQKTISAKSKHYYKHETASWINVVKYQKHFFRNLPRQKGSKGYTLN